MTGAQAGTCGAALAEEPLLLGGQILLPGLLLADHVAHHAGLLIGGHPGLAQGLLQHLVHLHHPAQTIGHAQQVPVRLCLHTLSHRCG